MKSVFADTFYFLALLDTREEQHRRAVAISRDPKLRLVTTEWVLLEFADAYSQPWNRADFIRMYRAFAKRAEMRIVPANSRMFKRGVELFELRRDKYWSLTDCLSFVVMRELRIGEALTGDRHFEQAGFKALLR